MNYAYIRVSTKEQNEQRQIDAINNLNIKNVKIYKDKQSGKDFNRPGYIKLIKSLKQKDTLYILSIDRLGRNYDEIIKQWKLITKVIKADIVVLDMPLLDTRNNNNTNLTNTLIADIVLQLLSYVAQTEREFIRQRQAEGIASAKARGVRFGRKPKDKPVDFYKYKNDYLNHNISARKAAKQLNISHKTFLSWIKQEQRDG